MTAKVGPNSEGKVKRIRTGVRKRETAKPPSSPKEKYS